MLLYARTVPVLLALVASPALATCPDPCPDPTGAPMTGEINYGAGAGAFPQPFTISTIAVGGFDLRDCGLEGEGLTGYDGDGLVEARPDLVLNWRGGPPELTIAFENQDDPLLLVSTPGGTWHFSDDGADHNPQIVIPDPAMGKYAIFVGTHGLTRFSRPGTLTIKGPDS